MVICNLSEEDLHRFIYRFHYPPQRHLREAFAFNRINFPHSDTLLNRVEV